MRILSWNVNGLEHALSDVQRLAKSYNPDVICLQETKVSGHVAIDGYLVGVNPALVTINEGLDAGTLIAIKDTHLQSLKLYTDIEGFAGRLGLASFGDYNILNYYAINTRINPDMHFTRAKCDRLIFKLMQQLGGDVILCGDLNVTPGKELILPGEEFPLEYCRQGKNFEQPYPEREWLYDMLNHGWYDALRYVNPQDITPTYQSTDRAFVGRLDYFILNHPSKIDRCVILPKLSSNHCPILLDIR